MTFGLRAIVGFPTIVGRHSGLKELKLNMIPFLKEKKLWERYPLEHLSILTKTKKKTK